MGRGGNVTCCVSIRVGCCCGAGWKSDLLHCCMCGAGIPGDLLHCFRRRTAAMPARLRPAPLLPPPCAPTQTTCRDHRAVRGAYMVLERQRAKDLGYPSPIHDTADDTHANYNE